MESWQPYPPKITTLKICPRTWRNSSQLLSRKKWIAQNAKPAKNISLDTSRKLINQNGIELWSTCLFYLIQFSILIQSYEIYQFLWEISHMKFCRKYIILLIYDKINIDRADRIYLIIQWIEQWDPEAVKKKWARVRGCQRKKVAKSWPPWNKLEPYLVFHQEVEFIKYLIQGSTPRQSAPPP